MKKINKFLIWLLIIMILSLITSGFFFLKSGLIDFENQKINSQKVEELELFNKKINKLLGIPTNKYKKESTNNLIGKNSSYESGKIMSCNQKSDCQTPTAYLIQSNCPYTSLCINNICKVACPIILKNNASCKTNSDCNLGNDYRNFKEYPCIKNKCYGIVNENS